MELRNMIETVFQDGRTAQHRLGTWRCTAEHLHPDGIGLLLEDGHSMLAQIQKVAIEAQMEEISATCRACPCCGKVRPIHDYRTRTFETLFGRLLWSLEGESPPDQAVPVSGCSEPQEFPAFAAEPSPAGSRDA